MTDLEFAARAALVFIEELGVNRWGNRTAIADTLRAALVEPRGERVVTTGYVRVVGGPKPPTLNWEEQQGAAGTGDSTMMEEMRMDDSRRQVQDWLAQNSNSVSGATKESIRAVYLENKELRGRVGLLSKVLAEAAAKGFGLATSENA